MLQHILLIVTYFTQFIYLRVPRLTLTVILKVVSNHGVFPKLTLKRALSASNDILPEHWSGLLSSLEFSRKLRWLDCVASSC